MTMIVTFVATLTLGIQNGVFTGVILSLAFMIYRNSKPHISILPAAEFRATAISTVLKGDPLQRDPDRPL